MAENPRRYETARDREGVLCERAAEAVAPFQRQLPSENRERRRFPALRGPSSHAAPRLRLRPCRSRRGYAAHSGLSRAPEDRGYGEVHRHESGPVRKTLAIAPVYSDRPLFRDPADGRGERT